jgi:hypothetical protein
VDSKHVGQIRTQPDGQLQIGRHPNLKLALILQLTHFCDPGFGLHKKKIERQWDVMQDRVFFFINLVISEDTSFMHRASSFCL